MDFAMFEAITVITWLLFALGFLDRIFFLISAIIGFFFATLAMNDGTFVLAVAFNISTASWVQYTINVYPDIILMVIPVIASTLFLLVRLTRGTEEEVLF